MPPEHAAELALLSTLETRAMADLEVAEARVRLAKCIGARVPHSKLKLAKGKLVAASSRARRRRGELSTTARRSNKREALALLEGE